MKKVLILLVATFGLQAYAASTGSSSAQSSNMMSSISEGPLHIIPVIGMNSMSLRGDQNATGSDTGLSLGGLVDIGNGSLSLESGLLFNQFGGKLGTTQYNLNYISVPAVAKWNIMGMQERTAYMKGGLMPSILAGQTANDNNSKPNDLNAKTFDVGLIFGVGGTIPVASRASLVLDVSYIRGLSTVSNKLQGQDLHNEGLIFQSGVSIAL